MNRNIIRVCIVLGFCLLTGCSSEKKTGIEVTKKQPQDTAVTTEAVYQFAMDVDLSERSSSRETADAKESPQETPLQNEAEDIVVYVCGAVNCPGVYTLKGNSRVTDAVDAAGGMSPDANGDVLNLAQFISDGQMIRIPRIGEDVSQNETTGQTEVQSGAINSSSSGQNNKVNLNTADKTQLMTIPGIGESKALAIIKYREENGRFEAIEDIMKITGIKEASFAKMEPYICVQ